MTGSPETARSSERRPTTQDPHLTPHNPTPALSLVNLTRRFGAQAAVDHLSLDVARGELLALVGASGSGKTTTLRMIAGYEYPDEGRVMLADGEGEARDITALPPQRRHFGMVFQHYALFPHMTVGENVAFGLEARGVSKRERLERAERALAATGLAGARGRAVQSLSGGEQQRVALARAMVIEPQVLLLDEPLSNLDFALRRAMHAELRGMLRRFGATVVFVTHDQEDAFAVADRVALLAHGRLLQVGTPENLYDRPVSRAVAEFIGRATLVPARVEGERDGERAIIRLGESEQCVAAAVPPEWRGEGEAFAVLRPDALAFAPPDALNGWPGEVVGRRFAGVAVTYVVRLSHGVEVEVTSRDRSVREGERVALRIAHEPVAVVEG
ncbi:MAG TPA: ABC transporter ATP-binding protein [Gemmatimonadaceae bacterium]|nr:ABC transporter ATP-binding protein [Gemmatimonadaceae bacterium]